ncbi:DUF6708 domain-containing protein [Arhodomonas aquaeolei]|uniref:DUF6708 domain-containing protein n=1 Tax=Arhodomonas aquaeolei TaxID=2369 RepID=UPI0012ECAEA7|nr:DUF6708 domain-containing protein [Arhodomonas aquaeolei]
MELVDRWYADKGTAVIYGILGGVPSFLGVAVCVALPVVRNELGAWVIAALGCSVFGFLFWVSIRYLLLEAHRKTHYPIRLNRKNRMVYAFRPDGTIIRVPWDDLFLTVGESYIYVMGKFHDIRAHILDADGRTVRDTFTLGYPVSGAIELLPGLWEYIRRYMEEPEGVRQNYEHTDLCMPIGERREGVRFGIVRAFGIIAAWPLFQLVLSPLLAVITWGRLIAMYTSRPPRWPADIEAECVIDDDDPYRKDWRDNGAFTFIEGTWPVICFVFGSVVAVIAIYSTITAIIDAL